MKSLPSTLRNRIWERTLGLIFRVHGLRTLTYQPSGTWANRSTKYKCHVHILYSLSMWIQCKKFPCVGMVAEKIKDFGLITAKMLFIQKNSLHNCIHFHKYSFISYNNTSYIFLKNIIHFKLNENLITNLLSTSRMYFTNVPYVFKCTFISQRYFYWFLPQPS